MNYRKALASLNAVYDNKCLIFFDTVSQLFDLPSMTKPSASRLRSIIDTVSAIYSSLSSLGNDKNIASAMIIHLVMAKVDHVTKSRFEEQLDYDTLPSWEHCARQRNKRYRYLSGTKQSRELTLRSHQSKSSFACADGGRLSSSVCVFYKAETHNIYSCPSFAAVSVMQRFEFVKTQTLCLNC